MEDDENIQCADRVDGYTPLWMLLMPPDSAGYNTLKMKNIITNILLYEFLLLVTILKDQKN